MSVIQGCVKNGASKIIVVDVNDKKEEWGQKFGATHFVNPTKLKEGETIQQRLIEMTDGGCDYTFDCTGNVHVMRSALEACHKGWGESVIIGVAAAGQEISTRRKSFSFSTFLSSLLHLALMVLDASQFIDFAIQYSIPARHRPCVEGMRIWRCEG